LIPAIDAYRTGDASSHSLVYHAAHGALGLKEAKVLGDEHRSPHSPGPLDDRDSFLQIAGEGLFYHHGEAGSERLERVLRVQERGAGNENRVGLRLRQGVLEASEKFSMFLSRRTARRLQGLLLYVDTSGRSEVGVSGDKVQPMTSPAADSNMNDSYGHLQFLISRESSFPSPFFAVSIVKKFRVSHRGGPARPSRNQETNRQLHHEGREEHEGN
jgi:hypothetical protein